MIILQDREIEIMLMLTCGPILENNLQMLVKIWQTLKKQEKLKKSKLRLLEPNLKPKINKNSKKLKQRKMLKKAKLLLLKQLRLSKLKLPKLSRVLDLQRKQRLEKKQNLLQLPKLSRVLNLQRHPLLKLVKLMKATVIQTSYHIQS